MHPSCKPRRQLHTQDTHKNRGSTPVGRWPWPLSLLRGSSRCYNAHASTGMLATVPPARAGRPACSGPFFVKQARIHVKSLKPQLHGSSSAAPRSQALVRIIITAIIVITGSASTTMCTQTTPLSQQGVAPPGGGGGPCATNQCKDAAAMVFHGTHKGCCCPASAQHAPVSVFHKVCFSLLLLLLGRTMISSHVASQPTLSHALPYFSMLVGA